MTALPYTAARVWCLQQYRIARRQGATPLQAMLEIYELANWQVSLASTAETEWRKAVANRYFKVIAVRANAGRNAGYGPTLHAMYWRNGRCLAMSS